MTRVLLVEDEPGILETQTVLLSQSGFEVIGVSSATEATMILRGEPHIDVLFSDIRLGAESGLELAYYTQVNHPDVAIVLTTGYSGGPAIHWPLLMKPFLNEQAVELINQTLARRA